MRYRLSSLLIVLTLGPPLLGGAWLFRRGLLSPFESVQLWLAVAFLLCIAAASVVGGAAAWTIDSIADAWRGHLNRPRRD
jgi:hypothetical protein